MTEQVRDQISAFIDDELSPEECEFFVRRLERDPATRRRIVRYLTVGAALRRELLPCDTSLLRRRIDLALGGLPHKAPRRRFISARFVRPALGFGIAASVALVAVLSLRLVNGRGDDAAALPASLQAARSLDAPSYVVPLEPARAQLVNPPIRLTNYLMHHGEYASGLNRTLVRSSVVSTREADIGAEGEEAR